MPGPITYPGVYIEEIPGGVRPIEGVPTSIVAFVGGTVSGPARQPTMCDSFADFERRFGGLAADVPLGFAVRDFYGNGGSQALIIRATGAGATPATLNLQGAGGTALVLEAVSAGAWGNGLRAAIEHGIGFDAGTFDLIVEYTTQPGGGIAAEIVAQLSLDENAPRFVTNVLAVESSFVRVRSVSGFPDETFEAGPPPVVDWSLATGGSDGAALTNDDVIAAVESLRGADLFNLLCIPPTVRGGHTHEDIYRAALAVCVERRAMLIVDPRPEWAEPQDALVANAIAGAQAFGFASADARNACLYVPSIQYTDPLSGQNDTFAPCGAVAGIFARTDATQAVWQAPIGGLDGVQSLQVNLTDQQNATLSRQGINCLRSFPGRGLLAWGARTMRGADQATDEYKYVPVRRLALFIEESLYRGLRWTVFEPNDEATWTRIRSDVGAFMHDLFRQGAFQGSTPREAYFVICDATTTTASEIDLGIVNVVIGFAPVKPAEFVMIAIQQLTRRPP